MAKLKKDLQAVTRELKALTKKTEKLVKVADKLAKAQAPKKAKAKPTKKTVAKKTTARKQAPAKKKATALTATDQVVKIIERSKKGVDAPTLMKKTGFEAKTVRNIIFRASKQGKIKRAGRGIYIAT